MEPGGSKAMSHQITNVEYHWNEHDRSHVFNIEFDDGDYETLNTIDNGDPYSGDGDIHTSISTQGYCENTRRLLHKMSEAYIRNAGRFYIEEDYTGPKHGVDILNYGYNVDDEMIIVEHSGELEDLPDEIKDVITWKRAKDLDAGDWITFIDGEIKESGEFHPFLVYYQR